MSGVAPAVQWVTAAPLWPASPDPLTMRRPAIIRFDSDDFMADLLRLLDDRPERLVDQVAEAVSYRSRPPGAASSWTGHLPELKLYHPAHGHFNLVVGALVCRIPGMPDRLLDDAAEESVGFVLRRLLPAEGTTFDEAAWTDDPGDGLGWRPITGRERQVAPSEEILPLFALKHGHDRIRRTFAGLIPTSSGDTFKAAARLSPFSAEDPLGTPFDARLDDLDTRVVRPLGDLRAAELTPADLGGQPAGPFVEAGGTMRREASAFLLVDLAEFLAARAPSAWAAVAGASEPSAAGPIRDLYRFLVQSLAGAAGAPTLRAALLDAWDRRMAILGETNPAPTYTIDLKDATFSIDGLRSAVEAVLPPADAAGASSAPPAAAGSTQGAQVVGSEDDVPKLHPSPGALFVVRCVFRRPQCQPPVDIVGEASERFTIASFFDVDAPARAIRVQLPVRTSIADLRKYPKNVGFVLSDQLREQMTRVTDLNRILKGELASGDGFDVGLLCSFSIPIITICALIVLMIFIGLLNIVFWWSPFLKICLPIALPGKRS